MTDPVTVNRIAHAIRGLMQHPESPVAIFGVLDLDIEAADYLNSDLWFREIGLTDEQYDVVLSLLTCGQPHTSWNGCRP